MRNRYPLEAMQSSQMNMVNRTGILISTAYESLNNPMTEEVDYASKVLNGHIDDKQIFSMLYRPDDNDLWMEDDELLKANPLAIDLPENFEFLKKKRKEAIEVPSKQKNFKTKHMNIFVDGDDSEVYISTENLRKCKLDEEFDWTGQRVFIGLDLAQTTDNTAVSMVTYDEYTDKYIVKSWAFLPRDRADEKSRLEKLDYRLMEKQGFCYLCGDNVIDYRFVENFILNLEKEYDVQIDGIGYDKYNAISSVNRLSEEGGYDVIEIQQHSRVLHAPTKYFNECVLTGRMGYEDNVLFEINVANARTVLDTNLNMYVNKRKSNGKIDMLAATLNAMTLWNKEHEDGASAYEDRGILIL